MSAAPSCTPRIIRFFARFFGAAALLAAGGAAAQPAYQIQLDIAVEAQHYTVAPTAVPAGQRVEVRVSPGGMRAYVRAIRLQGVEGQMLLEVQLYEPVGSNQAQVAVATIPSFVGADNTAELVSAKGKVRIKAFVDAAAPDAATAPAAAGPASTPYISEQGPAGPTSTPLPKGLDAPLPAPKPIKP